MCAIAGALANLPRKIARTACGGCASVRAIIHSGAAGAMRPFSKRGVTQDQILKIIAYIHTLKK